MAKWIKLGIKIVAAIVLLIFLRGKVQGIYEFWDSDKDRGAVAIDKDVLGESFSTPVYLDQGWDESQSLWFYNITQGSNLVPYDFFMALEQEKSDRLFRDNENLNAYRFLPQKATFSNPDNLPVGFVMDTYQGKEYMGFTCAACHTNQVNYQGKAIRIDGGPAMADVDAFLIGLQKALIATRDNAEKKARFVKGVLDRNGFGKILTGGRNYASEEDVLAELKIYCNRMLSYTKVWTIG